LQDLPRAPRERGYRCLPREPHSFALQRMLLYLAQELLA
jgi:hypothetical protein